MATQNVYIEVKIRDLSTPEREVVAIQMANGTTEDDGATVVIPNGYVPGIETAEPADIMLQLQPPAVQVAPSGLTSRLNDFEANTSTLSFTFPA